MRIKTGTVRKQHHKKVLDSVKGHRLARSKHYKVAKEDALHAGQYAFVGRKNRKRDFRRLWITRISAGLSQIENGPSYSIFNESIKAKARYHQP
jgi:large subunit ribosomal protein L20